MSDWRHEALCAQIDVDMWFPPKGGNYTDVIAICNTCPVKAQCLQLAVDEDLEHGIFGGTTASARIKMRRASGRSRQRSSEECPQGHSRAFSSYIRRDGSKYCRECHKLQRREAVARA